MKNTYFPKVVILTLLLILIACNKDNNHAPTINITKPEADKWIPKGFLVEIVAEVDEEDGDGVEVRWFIDNTYKNSISSQYPFVPFIYYWNTDNVGTGLHSIKATAKDEHGLQASDEIEIMIYIHEHP